MKSKFFINATNVHQGGGKSLLIALLSSIPEEVELIVLVDKRIELSQALIKKINIRYVEPKITRRVASEKWLSRHVTSNDIVLCFGNLPPLFKLKGRVVLFLQNRYLIKDEKINNLTFYLRLRIWLERLWLYKNLKNADEVIVQTPTFRKSFMQTCKDNVSVTIMPFIETPKHHHRKSGAFKSCSVNTKFLYVASGEAHKNHKVLVEAWCLLAKEEIYPSLKLTVNEEAFPELCYWMNDKANRYQLSLHNCGDVERKEVIRFYDESDALIYPSLLESFGLPLFEARQKGLPILASELDYVRDAINPEQSFDPRSPISIARAVKRFMKIEEPKLSLLSPEDFMTYILTSKVS